MILKWYKEMSLDEFLEMLDDHGDACHLEHEAARRIRELRDADEIANCANEMLEDEIEAHIRNSAKDLARLPYWIGRAVRAEEKARRQEEILALFADRRYWTSTHDSEFCAEWLYHVEPWTLAQKALGLKKGENND